MIDDARIDDLLRLLPVPPEAWTHAAIEIPLVAAVEPETAFEPETDHPDVSDEGPSEEIETDWLAQQDDTGPYGEAEPGPGDEILGDGDVLG